MSQVNQPPAEKSNQFLLATKLTIPPTRADALVRTRLTDRLLASLRDPLTLITASAGFGKTTLLSTVLRQHLWSTAWVSLDSSDDDLIRFWSYVLAALEGIQQDVGKEIRKLLPSLRQLPIEAFLTTLINTMMQHEQDIILVLDDYHSISAQTIHTSLAFFLEHLPPHLHAIIASRIDPLLPLARWRTRGLLTEFRSSDLRFTVEETATFFQQTTGLHLSSEELQALDTRAEGWIAGLQLAALTMQGQKDSATFIKAFTGSQRYIVDYLMQEVFALQSEEVQTFLLRTCILERMCGSLCQAVTEQANGQAMLEHVERANLFLQPLDDERRWYRYHHLFAELLRYRLQYEQPALVPVLHHHASKWYEQHDLLPEAIEHALAAEDFQRAAQLIEDVSNILTKRGELITISSWLKKLPTDEMQARPGLVVIQAWLLFLTGQYAAAECQLQQIEQRYHIHAAMHALASHTSPLSKEVQSLLPLIGEIAAIRASIAIMHEDGERTIKFARLALQYIPEAEISRGLVTWYLGIAYWMAGNIEEAVQAQAEAAAHHIALGNLYMAFMATHELASLQVVQGHLYQAEETYQQALRLASRQGGSTVVLGPINVGIGNLQYEWNNLEVAERFLREGIEQCLQMENSRTALEGYISLALLKHAEGNQESLQNICEKMSSLARNSNIPPGLAAFSRAVQAWIAFKQGDRLTADRWLQECGLYANDEIHPLRFNEYLILVRVLIAQGKLNDAFTCLSKLSQLAQARKRIKNSIQVLILQALAQHAQDNKDEARAALENALLLAAPEGYIRLFIDEDIPFSLLATHEQPLASLQISNHTHPPTSYLEKLLSAAGSKSFPGPASPSQLAPTMPDDSSSLPVETLSERELEVLRLIAGGCSNREIADRLVLAVSTVKWYVNIIYGKLQVDSRTRAVARARELKLL